MRGPLKGVRYLPKRTLSEMKNRAHYSGHYARKKQRSKRLGSMLMLMVLMAGTATWGAKGASRGGWVELKRETAQQKDRINYRGDCELLLTEVKRVTRSATVDDYAVERRQRKEVVVLEEGGRLIP